MNRLRVAVLGYLVRGPIGGLAWHHLHYVLGLARLGHDVFFVEDSDDYVSCYDPGQGMTVNPAYGLRFTGEALGRLGLPERWAYYDAHTARWLGAGADKVLGFLGTADLLLNVSGVNPLRPWLLDIPARALIDTDPVFTQVRHLTDGRAAARADAHTSFFTFGENVPAGRSTVPDDGLPWQSTRQPIVLDLWPVARPRPGARFTTVMQWDSYTSGEYAGQRYGMKSDSFEPFLNLPSRTRAELELAVGSDSAPRDLLRKCGWRLRDPLEVTRDPWTYQDYLRDSQGEFAVAKHGYVATRSGWFSERSACYMASGRPVLLQDTGFTNWLPTGAGVLAFNDAVQALSGLDELRRTPALHAREARLICEAYFDAAKVLPSLLERALLPRQHETWRAR
jgi:hypothetical protein